MARASTFMEFELTARPVRAAPQYSDSAEHIGAEAGYGPPAIGDWRGAIADALARINASERRTIEAIARLARRVEAFEADVEDLRRRDDGPMRDLERRVVEQSDRAGRIEERLARSSWRR